MRDWLAAVVIGLAALGGPALAQTPPTAAPAAPAAASPSAAQVAQQDRMRSCNAEAGTRALTGDPRRAFMRECLAGHPSAATPAAAPTPGQSPSQSPGQSPGQPGPATTYRSEAEARTACGEDPVVWGTSDSRIFHLAGSRLYGKTQRGGYLCRSQAELSGYRAAR